jgi:hypothetical protein
LGICVRSGIRIGIDGRLSSLANLVDQTSLSFTRPILK